MFLLWSTNWDFRCQEMAFFIAIAMGNLKFCIALTGCALERKRNVSEVSFVSQKTPFFIVTAVKI
jgi:hypothetical protein